MRALVDYDDEDYDPEVGAAHIRRVVTLPPAATLAEVCEAVYRAARNGCETLTSAAELPYRFATAAAGIQWARASARISGSLEMALRRLDAGAAVRLIARAAACPTQGEVPRWLNAHLEEIAGA